MFLIHSLLVFTAVYWHCALLAELVLTSPEERALPEPVRAGVAFLFSTTYFAAAWQLMSIGQAWALGASLLAMYFVATAPADWRTGCGPRLRAFVWRNARGFSACLAGALLLFAPMMIANKYGPFTEGGGDVSIYADTTQYLTEHGLTVKGAPSRNLDHAVANLKASTDTTIDRDVLNRYAEQRYLAADRSLINPPSTDNAAYRVVVTQAMSSFLYPPYGQFYFLAGSTNYHVYYGIQAFIYGVMLASACYVFRNFRLPAALAYAGLVAASHALVSVFYNTYSAQTISLFMSALVLALLPSIRLFAWSGMRTYMIPTAYIWISYVHFLSLVLPLLLVAGLRSVPAWRGAPAQPAPARKAPVVPSRRVLRWVVIGAFAFLVGLLVLSGAQKSVLLVVDLTGGLLSGEKNVYMGERIKPFSLRWLSFLFGFISQQHLQPFAVEIGWVLRTIHVGVVMGVASFVLGLAAIAKMIVLPAWREDAQRNVHLVLYGVLLVTVAVHVYLAQAYIYTQAKGAQNILLLLYAALVLPFALGACFRKRDRTLDMLTSALGVTLLLFIATLLAPRAIYAVKLAQGKDRATILEPSYFAEARKIRDQDRDPFVLFEPRKSGDLYMSIQPFSGARMAPTRHLGLTWMNFEKRPPQVERIDASLLIRAGDLPHLWTLSARKADGGASHEWAAERVVAGKTAAVYLFGDDYEQDVGEKPRGAGPGDAGMFSYVRNGSVMVYMPPGQAMSLEVTLAPRDISAVEMMWAEVSGRMKRGEFRNVEMTHAGEFITLRRRFRKRGAPTLVPIARYSGEYWVNVRVDGKDLVSTLVAP